MARQRWKQRETIGAGDLVGDRGTDGAATSQKGIRGCKERHLKRGAQPNQAQMISDDWSLYV